MTALERIKEIEKYLDDYEDNASTTELEFLLRAFRVMREIAKSYVDDSQVSDLRARGVNWRGSPDDCIDQEFNSRMEQRMKDAKGN